MRWFAVVRERDAHVHEPNSTNPFHHVCLCDSKPITEPTVRGSNPEGLNKELVHRDAGAVSEFLDRHVHGIGDPHKEVG